MLTVHHAEPTAIANNPPVVFVESMNRQQRADWAKSMPVWSRFVNFQPNNIVVGPSSRMAGGDEADTAGLPICVYAYEGNEYEAKNHLHIFVNEDGTRGALLTAAPEIDEEAVALAIVRRDQGYGPAAE